MFEFLAVRLQRAWAQIPYLPRTLLLVWRASRGWMVAWLILLIFQGVLPAATVSLTRLLVDRLADSMRIFQAGMITWESVSGLVMISAVMGMLLLLSQVLGELSGFIREAQAERTSLEIQDLIHERSGQVDYAFFESPRDYDRLYRAREEAGYRPLALVDNLGSLLQNGITLIAMAAVLLPYSAWLPVLLLVSTLPALAIVIRQQRKLFAWQQRVTPDERRAWYYDSLLTMPESAAELRQFGLIEYFRSGFRAIRQRLFQERVELNRRQVASHFLAALLGLGVAAGCMVWMGWRALRGLATLGDLALFYQAFNQGQALLRTLLQNAGQVYGNLLFLGNLFEFLELPALVKDPAEPVRIPEPASNQGAHLRFENVSFSYPGVHRLVLEGFDLEIPPGKLIAIVGDNGAGKSTLVKLICRLYDPQAGRILWDETDLRKVSLADLRSHISILFQQPMHYIATVRENIAYGDLKLQALGDIQRAARQAGADQFIERLPAGYETQLGKWFEEGTELSVGQWQRLALGRALLRQAPLLLLDEPTSFMDAWAETDWLKHLNEIAAGRTTVLITHRLTTAIQADLIYVMAEGKIVEQGRHEDLIAAGGRYAWAWENQISSRKWDRA